MFAAAQILHNFTQVFNSCQSKHLLLLRDLRLKGGDLFYIPSSGGGSFNINTIKQITKLRGQFHTRDDPVAIKLAGNCVR